MRALYARHHKTELYQERSAPLWLCVLRIIAVLFAYAAVAMSAILWAFQMID